MESEVEKARMLLDDGEPEESMEAAEDKEKRIMLKRQIRKRL